MAWYDKLRGTRSSGEEARSSRASRPGEQVSPNSTTAGGANPGPASSVSADGPPSAATTKFIARAGELQAIPGMASRLLQKLEDPEVSADAIAQDVQRDQGLMAMVLRLANSAYYRSSGQVRDITESIVVLGYDSVKQLVLGRLSRQVMRRNDECQKILWRHALATALAAQACAREVRGITVAHAFTGGLLHDIGKAVMHEAFPDECAKVWKSITDFDDGSDEIERHEFSTDHNQVGAELLKQWQFPRMYWQVARLHSTPERSLPDPKEKRLVSIVSLSGAVASWCGYDAADRAGGDPHDHAELLNLAAATSVVDLMGEYVKEQLSPLLSIFS